MYYTTASSLLIYVTLLTNAIVLPTYLPQAVRFLIFTELFLGFYLCTVSRYILNFDTSLCHVLTYLARGAYIQESAPGQNKRRLL